MYVMVYIRPNIVLVVVLLVVSLLILEKSVYNSFSDKNFKVGYLIKT